MHNVTEINWLVGKNPYELDFMKKHIEKELNFRLKRSYNGKNHNESQVKPNDAL